MLVEALQTYLAADSGMQNILGTPTTRGGTTGLFPVIAPDECKTPYVVYQQVSGDPLQTSMQGTGRLHTARWRFSCHGDSYIQAKKTALALRKAFISMLGAIKNGNTVLAQIEGAWLKLEADDAEPIPHGTIYTVHVDFEFEYVDVD
jgi:hypothetical protein